ncbi:MAG: hypothetical protein QGF74_02970 [Candidatus Nanoarchaeia archaeon]|jgi:hypothetical protein|nr:hypothetical protein [Candidatus Nanoarchaeia archaeon]|tara:strand:- start:35300 stop:36232 length:933 start_codon:yes stop_codon:yes gene_type:complete
MNSNYKSDLIILKRIARESGLEEFWLGGSVVYNKIAKDMGVTFDYKDYDLAVKGGEKEYSSVKQKLKEHRFRIIKSHPYYLKFKKVFQIIAEKKSIHLDIVVLDELYYWGHFNFEYIFWHFPSTDVYDPYNALDAIKQKNLIPIISPRNENPFILTSRFVKLCARFNIDFINNKKLCSFAKSLARLIKEWNNKDPFHGKYAKEHAYFGMLQAILRSKKRKLFIERLQKSGILNAMFPEISKKLKTSNSIIKGIETAKSPEDVVRILRHLLKDDRKELQHFNKRLISISNRLQKISIVNKKGKSFKNIIKE